MLAKLFGSALHGVDAFRVTIEVSVSNGIGYQITGLPDDAIKESLCRIAIAITDSGYYMPRNKLVINLAPAGVRKIGTGFDLAIAIGILIASEQVSDIGKLKDYILLGEIGLDGAIHPVCGALCMAYRAKKEGFKGIILPHANAKEAALVKGISVFSVTHLRELIKFIQCDFMFEAVKPRLQIFNRSPNAVVDFSDVKGQHNVKRALEIAAAGGHNAILMGPPGIGKTMLAKRLPTIMPPMTLHEALETTRVYSVANNAGPVTGLVTERPFRNPHHTTSDVALVGGGSIPFPGEISLAHNGVLFLDELLEFKRSVIEVLRQPMEERKVLIARAKMSIEYPSSFMLIAATNPCFCGYFGHPTRKCTCSRRAIYWYRRRISGPLIERIDLHVEVEPLPMHELVDVNEVAESSSVIRERVIKARKIQLARFSQKTGAIYNAHMHDRDIERFCVTDEAAKKYLLKVLDQQQLSARSYSRILKLARTIADLAGKSEIGLSHIAEAIHFRSLDKPLIIPASKNKIVHAHSTYPFAI